MIENDDILIESIFSIYEFTLDKQDLTENLKILYCCKYRGYISSDINPNAHLFIIFRRNSEVDKKNNPRKALARN